MKLQVLTFSGAENSEKMEVNEGDYFELACQIQPTHLNGSDLVQVLWYQGGV
jgi:hypothetical protein